MVFLDLVIVKDLGIILFNMICKKVMFKNVMIMFIEWIKIGFFFKFIDLNSVVNNFVIVGLFI